MAGKFRRARAAQRSIAPRLESLETRALLSGDLLSGSSLTSISGAPAPSLLVRFQANASAAATQGALSEVGGRIVESFPDGPSVVELPTNADPTAALGLLQGNPSVVYAEPDATIRAA